MEFARGKVIVVTNARTYAGFRSRGLSPEEAAHQAKESGSVLSDAAHFQVGQPSEPGSVSTSGLHPMGSEEDGVRASAPASSSSTAPAKGAAATTRKRPVTKRAIPAPARSTTTKPRVSGRHSVSRKRNSSRHRVGTNKAASPRDRGADTKPRASHRRPAATRATSNRSLPRVRPYSRARAKK
jgi:hypothetical protein